MLQEISAFVNEQRIATISYVSNRSPYCFTCRYVFLADAGILVFKSSKSCLHGRILQDNIKVAGTIYDGALTGFDNTGIQFLGQMTEESELRKLAQSAYHKQFPMALLVPGQIFVARLDEIKLSRMRNGIKSKMSWVRMEGEM